jgi:hypothetical protein
MSHLKVTSGSHAHHSLAAGVLGQGGWCNSMRAVWVQLARQVRMSVDWLKAVRVGIVSETRERSRTWKGCHWSEPVARGSTSGLKLCAGGLCPCRSRAPIDREARPKTAQVEWRSPPFNLKRRRSSRPWLCAIPFAGFQISAHAGLALLACQRQTTSRCPPFLVVTQAMCTAVFVTQAQNGYSLTTGCLGTRDGEAGHREDVCVAAILQGLAGKGLRRTLCVQAWLSCLMRNVFIFGLPWLYPSLQFLRI